MENYSIDGAIAAPVTPFHSNGDINTGAIKDYVDFLACHGIDGVFILGTLGEGMSLTVEERKAVASEWITQSKEKLKHVVVHIGAGNLRDSIELAKHAESVHAPAIACISPTFFKPSSEEIMVDYLEQVASAAPKTPFYYYCINFMTGVYLNTPRILELAAARIPTLRGIKMSSRELPALLECTRICDGKMNVMVGTNENFLPTLSLGVRVPVLSGFLGTLFKRLRNAFDKGDMNTALKEQRIASDLMKIQLKYGGGTPVVKAVMKCYGLDLGPVRSPQKDLPQEKVEALRKDLQDIGFL